MRRFPGKWNNREKRLQGGMLLSYLSNRTIVSKDETFLGENFGEKLLGLWFARLFSSERELVLFLETKLNAFIHLPTFIKMMKMTVQLLPGGIFPRMGL